MNKIKQQNSFKKNSFFSEIKIDKFRIIILLLVIICMILIGSVLHFAQAVIVPLFIAWLLSHLLGPFVLFLNKKKIPLPIAITISLVLLIFVLYWIGVLIYASFSSLTTQLPMYNKQFTKVSFDLIDKIATITKSFSSAELILEIKKQLAELSGSIVSFIGSVFSFVTGFFSKLIMTFIFLFFMLLGKPFSDNKIKAAFPDSIADRLAKIIGSISTQIGQYLFLQTLISFITGVLVWLTCTIIGVGSPLTWGTLAFFLNFIPTVGSIVASAPPILVALLQYYPSIWPAVITFIVILSIQQIMGNFLTPKLMGDKLDISPVIILISLIFWGLLWGIIGALLSIIIASIIKIICDNIEPLNIIGILMSSGRQLNRDT